MVNTQQWSGYGLLLECAMAVEALLSMPDDVLPARFKPRPALPARVASVLRARLGRRRAVGPAAREAGSDAREAGSDAALLRAFADVANSAIARFQRPVDPSWPAPPRPPGPSPAPAPGPSPSPAPPGDRAAPRRIGSASLGATTVGGAPRATMRGASA